MLKRVLPTRSP